jgi:ABC-type glycerol-3-phosphate transport system permease component
LTKATNICQQDASLLVTGARSAQNFMAPVQQALIWLLIGLLLVVEVYPLLWLLLSSFKTNVELRSVLCPAGTF